MSGGLDDIREAMRGPYTCNFEIWGVVGMQPCGRMAVALQQRLGGGNPSPVCAYHARGEMVSLDEIAAALRRFGQEVTHET